ncbi:MAG: ABC transporter substrate-binding protein [Oscillospiraceae bacterium]|jgi:peptide/nickel transport system substrate-binding protein|nr:ABC transporter substrate-binding protein [Oscillospiraceae bacterium]
MLKRGLSVAALALLLTSCARFAGQGGEPADDSPVAPEPSGALVSAAPSVVPEGDGRFSLRYNPAASLNPITGTDTYNMELATLMYEGLFVLNADFSWQNALCESYETEDRRVYEFTFRDGVYMSDGSALSPYDVVYSINQAKQSSKYSTRLKNVRSAVVAGLRAVRVTLNAADARFPALLDIPIVKDGSSGTAPRGTGPYKYSAEGEARLVKNEYYARATALPFDEIYLVSCRDSELGEYFTESIIDLFTEDPSASRAPIHRDAETRYYNTTVMLYIGFNPRAAAVDDARFRRVVDLAVDRGAIVKDILGGRAVASPLALPPFYRLYDKTWESAARGDDDGGDRRTLISEALAEIGLADSDNDTYLEYPTPGGLAPFALDFIVSSENAPRVEAARSVSDALRRVGLNVILRELPTEEFKTALRDGNFDMYCGETRLSASFDLSPLVGSGGVVDFGDMGGGERAERNAAFLAAFGDFSERNAARALCISIAEDMTFIPIAYKQFAVHSGRGEITGLAPSQTGLFYNIAEWTADVK